MKNDIAGAKLSEDPKNSCTIQDLELTENNIQEISYVDSNGQPTDHKETYMAEAEFGYYYCNGCGKDWSHTALQTQEKAWKLTKEHLNEN